MVQNNLHVEKRMLRVLSSDGKQLWRTQAILPLFHGSRKCFNGWDFDFAEQGTFQSKGNLEGLEKSILAISLSWPTIIPSLDATVSSSDCFNSFLSFNPFSTQRAKCSFKHTIQIKAALSKSSLHWGQTSNHLPSSMRSYMTWPLPASLASSLMLLLTRFLLSTCFCSQKLYQPHSVGTRSSLCLKCIFPRNSHVWFIVISTQKVPLW